MVERNYFRMLSDEEASRYKFGFCKNCPFYECELVGEYSQFRKNHVKEQNHQQLGVLTLTDGRIVGTVTYIRSIEQADDNAIIYPQFDDAHLCSFDTDAVSYDPKLKDDCFMSCRPVNQIECGRKRVTEGIGDHYKVEIDYNGKIKKGVKDRWEPLQPVFISAQTGQGKNYFIEKELISYVKELNYQNKTDYKVLIVSNRRALKKQIENRLKGKTNLEEKDRDEDELINYMDTADVITYQGLLKKKKHFCSVQKYVTSRYIYVIWVV